MLNNDLTAVKEKTTVKEKQNNLHEKPSGIVFGLQELKRSIHEYFKLRLILKCKGHIESFNSRL